MGFFSLFKKQESVPNYESGRRKLNFNSYLDKEFYTTIIDNSQSMMLYYLKSEGWIGANKHFFEVMDIHDISEFKTNYDSIRDLFLEESEEIFTESDKSWLDYIKKYKNDGYKLKVSSKNNEILALSARCYKYKNNPNLYILELQDVTELHNANLKTKEIEQLKSRFLANIGHEFRTPMNAILGFVELLYQTPLNKNQLEYINMISKSSKNLMSNIESLLDLSQLQGGRLEVASRDFNLLPQMETLAYNFYKQGEEKGVKVLTFIDPKLPQEIFSDAKKINQIMFSLVQNAVKYTERTGKVIIEVKLLKRQQNGDCSVGFGVRDNGRGISAQQIKDINEPFTSTNQADGRLGVGLSLSHGLVKLLGSDLKVQSQEGTGTYINFVLDFKGSSGQNYKMIPKKKVKVLLLDKTKVDEANFLTIYLRSFAIDVVKSNVLDENVYNDIETLYIVADQNDSSWMLELGTYSKKAPIVLLIDENEKLQTKLTHIIDETVEKPLLPSRVAEHLYSMNSLGPIQKRKKEIKIKSTVKALVVEDNLINQRLIQIILQGYDIVVSTATDGDQAVEMATKGDYDIIFMDIDMPGKNGIEATKEIKSKMGYSYKTPIVALTAMAMDGDREMLLREGLDDYMSKPLNREKLEEVLDKHLKFMLV
jgi:CheY-like chemotaxis protein/signal transduction histidine kinase